MQHIFRRAFSKTHALVFTWHNFYFFCIPANNLLTCQLKSSSSTWQLRHLCSVVGTALTPVSAFTIFLFACKACTQNSIKTHVHRTAVAFTSCLLCAVPCGTYTYTRMYVLKPLLYFPFVPSSTQSSQVAHLNERPLTKLVS